MTPSAERLLLELLACADPAFDNRNTVFHLEADVEADVHAILDAFRLQTVRRYFRQVHWWGETEAATKADEAEPGLKLENVAAHSWHVADTVLLLAGRFDYIDADRALRLAILHDKLEMYTGDFDPVGPDGKGNDTHAFNRIARTRKLNLERQALFEYISGLRPAVRAEQSSLLEENIVSTTDEAMFVKAIDKLQALAFVHEKKEGSLTDDHIFFSIRYSLIALKYFPGLLNHYIILMNRFLQRIAENRGFAIEEFLGCMIAGLKGEVVGGSPHGGKDRADRQIRGR